MTCTTGILPMLSWAHLIFTWNVELLWLNESAFGFPNLPADVSGAKGMILGKGGEGAKRCIDLAAGKGEENRVQKLALMLSHWELPFQKR